MNEKEIIDCINYYFKGVDEREKKKKDEENKKKKEKETKQIVFSILSGIICLLFLYYIFSSIDNLL